MVLTVASATAEKTNHPPPTPIIPLSVIVPADFKTEKIELSLILKKELPSTLKERFQKYGGIISLEMEIDYSISHLTYEKIEVSPGWFWATNPLDNFPEQKPDVSFPLNPEDGMRPLIVSMAGLAPIKPNENICSLNFLVYPKEKRKEQIKIELVWIVPNDLKPIQYPEVMGMVEIETNPELPSIVAPVKPDNKTLSTCWAGVKQK